MTEIVLAIPKGALAIFARLTPGNRCKCNVKAADAPGTPSACVLFRGRRSPPAAQLQGMITTHIMISTMRTNSLEGGKKRVCFCRMQVAAGGIDSERPPGARNVFTGGERERALEEQSQGRQTQSLRDGGRAGKEVDKRRRWRLRRERKLEARCSEKFPKGIGLIFPLQKARIARVTLELMLGFFMKRERYFERSFRRRSF